MSLGLGVGYGSGYWVRPALSPLLRLHVPDPVRRVLSLVLDLVSRLCARLPAPWAVRRPVGGAARLTDTASSFALRLATRDAEPTTHECAGVLAATGAPSTSGAEPAEHLCARAPRRAGRLHLRRPSVSVFARSASLRKMFRVGKDILVWLAQEGATVVVEGQVLQTSRHPPPAMVSGAFACRFLDPVEDDREVFIRIVQVVHGRRCLVHGRATQGSLQQMVESVRGQRATRAFIVRKSDDSRQLVVRFQQLQDVLVLVPRRHPENAPRPDSLAPVQVDSLTFPNAGCPLNDLGVQLGTEERAQRPTCPSACNAGLGSATAELRNGGHAHAPTRPPAGA